MRRALLLLPLLLLPLAACGNDDGAGVRASASASGSGSGSGSGSASAPAEEAECEIVGEAAGADTSVDVELGEFFVRPLTREVDAGTVTFDLDNTGGEPHELVVVRARTDDLVVEDGQVQEDDLADGAFIGEVEPFPPGECQGTFDLDPGDYTLFCNIVEGDESHFEEGMHVPFRVT